MTTPPAAGRPARSCHPAGRQRHGTLILGSLHLGDAVRSLNPGRLLFVPTAANRLPDRDDIVDTYRSQLDGLDAEIVDYDLDSRGAMAGFRPWNVDAVFCAGGDPYYLLEACRRSGFDRWLRRRHATGMAYVGASAGAIVAGPSLDPIRHVTPFSRPAGLDGTGLGLTQIVVLPHDNRPERRAAHADALSAYGPDHHLVPLSDAEIVHVDATGWRRLSVGRGELGHHA